MGYFKFFGWFISLLAVALVFTAIVFGMAERYSKPPEVQVVYKEPTDEQLTAFWFGDGDKAALRKRICK